MTTRATQPPSPDQVRDQVLWSPRGAPRSALFDDLYFSDEDGLAESRHVFVEGSGLPARLRRGGSVRIGEIGFGFGLNAVVAWMAVDAARAEGADASLTYFSVERQPPTADETRRALSPWPELAPKVTRLLSQGGFDVGPAHRELTPWFTVEVAVGEAETVLDRAPTAPCDIWWLDGFSPAKNPEAWTAAVMTKVFAATQPGGAVATYAAAGWVRRGLQAAGFRVTRRPGFGPKRHCVAAYRPPADPGGAAP